MGMNLSAAQLYVTFGGSTMGGFGGMGGGKMQPPTGDRPDDMPEPPDDTQPSDRTPPAGTQPSDRTPPDGTPPDGFGDFGGFGGTALVAKGSTLTIASGSDTLFSETAPCDVRFVFFTAPELSGGESCTLNADAETAETAEAQTGETQTGFGGKPTGDPPARPDGEAPTEQPTPSDGTADASETPQGTTGTTTTT